MNAAQQASAEPTPNPTVMTGSGLIEGRVLDGIERFLGIPYAAAPFGERRFLAPQPVDPWEGTRQADAFGPTAPQEENASPGGLPDVAEPIIHGDDCLNLNVWAPTERSEPLPVLVWVHGGGFIAGCSANPWYDGTSFAKNGLVVVTVNYRLGAEGFLELEGAPSNRGILDVMAALTWVHDEIAAFGGDPDRVTVMGQSAGGMAVTALLGTPAAGRLFTRAIIASGVSDVSVWSRDEAIEMADAVAAEAGIPRTRAAASRVSPAALITAHASVVARTPSTGPVLPWGPMIDDDLLAGTVFDSIAAGSFEEVPVLVGSTAHEFTWMGYRDRPDDAAGRDAAQRDFTDGFLRFPTHRFAEARAAAGAAPTFRYEFQWESTAAPYIRAGHSLDIPFFFNTLEAPYFADYAGDAPPAELAESMHGAFAAFASTGDAGWPAYTAGGAVRVFDSETRTGTAAEIGFD
jgi:para-nitrobenzyl esterase